MIHKMIVEIDIAKMRRDDVPESNIQDLLDFIKSDIPEYTITQNEEKENLYFLTLEVESGGIQSYLTDELEALEWFMKYVSKWEIYDGDMYNDMIRIERAFGERCSYA